MKNKLKVMHGPSEVAGQNSYSVLGLKEIGVDANCVVFIEHDFKYPYDISLGIDKSKKLLYPAYVLKLGCFFIFALFKYNVFHFHFGHSILNNVELPFYDLLGKKYFYEFHGSDLRDNKTFYKKIGLPFDIENATSSTMKKRNAKICRRANGIIVHDDELIPYIPNTNKPVFVVPLRVNLSKFEPNYPLISNNRIRIVHAPSRRAIKGTQYVLQAFNELKKSYNNIELVLVEGKSQSEALEIYKTADIIVDQLLIGTYGVFAIESMALGKPVIVKISSEMKNLLPEDLPVVSADKYTIKEKLEELILDPKLRNRKGIEGRQYVENYHNYRYIAEILKKIYEGKESPKSGRAAFARVKEIKNKNNHEDT